MYLKLQQAVEDLNDQHNRNISKLGDRMESLAVDVTGISAHMETVGVRSEEFREEVID